jgi:uncharacterized damage-inducible protein DinB
MSSPQPEPWLRGSIAGIPPLLPPAAHAFVMALEDTTAAVEGLTIEQLWLTPGGAASIGFHLQHLSGSTDGLLTYARGERLSEAQRAALVAEASRGEPRPSREELLSAWQSTVAATLEYLSSVSEERLLDARTVGRAQLPSTMLGLIFHAAEHAARHTGQLVTTAKILRGKTTATDRAEGS